MLIKNKRRWELPESEATPERHFVDRRRLLKAMGAGSLILAAPALIRPGEPNAEGPLPALTEVGEDSPSIYPVPRNSRYQLDRPLTDESYVTTYNNFYEFGSHKRISRAAQALPIRPWEVRIEGMVERPITTDIDDLLKRMPLEERLYRHRCVEAWSMAVPWSGFPMKALVEFARPLSGAKHVRMETFHDSAVAPGQRQAWYPWPYTEGLTIAEATSELAFIATGVFGKPLPKQNGAPLRLAVPWKYGFKSIKSIVRFTFTATRPKTFWERIAPKEYGFWANVNPEVPHPRWSQATERILGTDERVPTQIYNGYGEFVAHLYKGMTGERLFV